MCRANNNTYVFSERLNFMRLSYCRSLEGNEFHRHGPASAKHRLLKVLCDRQAARSCRRCTTIAAVTVTVTVTVTDT